MDWIQAGISRQDHPLNFWTSTYNYPGTRRGAGATRWSPPGISQKLNRRNIIEVNSWPVRIPPALLPAGLGMMLALSQKGLGVLREICEGGRGGGGLRLYPVVPPSLPTPLPAHENTHSHILTTSLLSPKSQAGTINPLLKNNPSKWLCDLRRLTCLSGHLAS